MNKASLEFIAGNMVSMLISIYPEKQWSVITNGEGLIVVAFLHNGTDIEDPFMSECGRFEYLVEQAMDAYDIERALAFTLKTVNKYMLSLQST